jgi:hypothetical protein
MAAEKWLAVEAFRARHAELLYRGVKDDYGALHLVDGCAECTWAVCEDRVADGAERHLFTCNSQQVRRSKCLSEMRRTQRTSGIVHQILCHIVALQFDVRFESTAGRVEVIGALVPRFCCDKAEPRCREPSRLEQQQQQQHQTSWMDDPPQLPFDWAWHEFRLVFQLSGDAEHFKPPTWRTVSA